MEINRPDDLLEIQRGSVPQDDPANGRGPVGVVSGVGEYLRPIIQTVCFMTKEGCFRAAITAIRYLLTAYAEHLLACGKCASQCHKCMDEYKCNQANCSGMMKMFDKALFHDIHNVPLKWG
jgi:hypothetical protein